MPEDPTQDPNQDPTKNPDDKGDETSGNETLKIGEEELTPDQAKELVDSGKSFKELKEQYPDVDFKELVKGFTQTRQELAELKKAKEGEGQVLTDEEQKRVEQIDAFFNDPLVAKRLDDRDKQKEAQIKEDMEFNKVRESLEAELDGEDGRPKFDYLKVLDYGKQNGIFNLRAAYNEMHRKELEELQLKKALEKKKPSTFSEKFGGQGPRVPEPKNAPKNFKEATKAALTEEE